jgi:3-oxoadipate enol-lactonase
LDILNRLREWQTPSRNRIAHYPRRQSTVGVCEQHKEPAMTTTANLARPDGAKLHYTIDDYTDPWSTPETALFVHGLAESGEAWRAWVPHFVRRYRVVRVDLRGFGQSTPMTADYQWDMNVLLDDLAALIEHLGRERVHLIGAKSGGSMTLKFAADHPDMVHTLVGVTPPVAGASAVPEWLARIESRGVLDWARHTMQGRLGSKVSAEEVEWWVNNIQGKTPLTTLQSYLRWVPGLDIAGEVEKITAPTLIITTTGSGLRTIASVKAWQQRIQKSQLVIVEGDAWHAAGAYPDRCAAEAVQFIDAQHSLQT